MSSTRQLAVILLVYALVSWYTADARQKTPSQKLPFKPTRLNPNEEAKGCLKDPTQTLMQDAVCGFDKQKKMNITFGSMEEFEEASCSNENLEFKKSDYCSEQDRFNFCENLFILPDVHYLFCAETPGMGSPTQTFSHPCNFLRERICMKKPDWFIVDRKPCSNCPPTHAYSLPRIDCYDWHNHAS